MESDSIKNLLCEGNYCIVRLECSCTGTTAKTKGCRNKKGCIRDVSNAKEQAHIKRKALSSTALSFHQHLALTGARPAVLRQLSWLA